MMQLISFIFFIAVSFLLGCTAAPKDIDGQPLQRIAPLGTSQIFSGSKDSSKIAYANKGLHLLSLNPPRQLTLSKSSPVKVSWSPTNDILATVYRAADYKSRLVQYSADGLVLVDTVLPINISRLAWSVRGDLLAVGYSLQTFSFGGNLQQYLYRFSGSEVVKVKLDDVTLKPRTVKWLAKRMSKVLSVHFTSYGDEFYYVRLHDPPEFPPYLDIAWMNWQTGEGKAVKQFPLQEVAMAKGDSEDSVIVVHNKNKSEINVWGHDSEESEETQARYGFIEGRLLDGEKVVAHWGEEAQLQILPGGNYLLAKNNTLYRGSGLQPQANQTYSEKKWTLRRWRASGLISPQEYLDKLKDD